MFRTTLKITGFFVSVACLVFIFSNVVFTLAQETPPAEPPTIEQPADLPTSEPPTVGPPTAEPPTLEPATIEPPPTIPTETPLVPTSTDILVQIPTETPTTDLSASVTLESIITDQVESFTDTPTPTATITATFTPTPIFMPTATLPTVPDESLKQPTPGVPSYLASAKNSLSSASVQGAVVNGCSTVVTANYAIVAPPATGSTRSGDFYNTLPEIGYPGNASPYPIYLCPGEFPLNETVVLYGNVNFYGRGVDITTFKQSAPASSMGGMFTLNGNTVEFHNLTVANGLAKAVSAGATNGAGIVGWNGTLKIFDSKFTNNEAIYSGGGIYGGENLQIERSIFDQNKAGTGGAIYTGNFNMNCVRFSSNTANAGRGGAIYINGNGIVATSSFTGNLATVSANQIYNSTPSQYTNAKNNWWATPPATPNQISAGVTTTPTNGSDPTSGYATGNYYSAPCAMNTPPPLPGYKVNIIDDSSRAWSGREKYDIKVGTDNVGVAFDALATSVSTPENAFNLVMLESSGTEILFIRTNQSSGTVTISNYKYIWGANAGQTATFSYSPVPQGYCISYQEGTVSSILRPAAVICNGNLIDHYSWATPTYQADEYTVIHELGHLFDYRTGSGISGPIGTNQVSDCDLGVVMGMYSGSWTRGRRGWGTGPAQYLNVSGTPIPLVSNFQQDPLNNNVEAAADSFLNWIYRLNTSGGVAVDSCTLTPRPPSNTWGGPGFLNEEWPTAASSFPANSNGIPGTPDASLPGDRRHFSMDTLMRQVFTSHGW